MLRVLSKDQVQELQADIRQVLRARGAASLAADQLSLVCQIISFSVRGKDIY
jgi:hypothetical protein